MLLKQAARLFRSPVCVDEVDTAFKDSSSSTILSLPNTMLELQVDCSRCKKRILARAKFCSECGHPNKDHDAAAAVIMERGRRKGAKRVRPSEFDVEQLVRDHFTGLRAVTDAGKHALEDGDSSSGSTSGTSDAEEVAEALPAAVAQEPPAAVAAVAEAPPVYDPPTIHPAQLRTKPEARKAWVRALCDIKDPKNKQAFLWWLPEFMDRLKTTPALADSHVPSHLTFEEYHKSHIDKVVSKTPDERRAWYEKRLAIMMSDMEQKAAPAVAAAEKPKPKAVPVRPKPSLRPRPRGVRAAVGRSAPSSKK